MDIFIITDIPGTMAHTLDGGYRRRKHRGISILCGFDDDLAAQIP